jgi:uncharacterized protein (DUF1800 family)
MSTLHRLLEPYQPTDADPFDAVKAAHLLNRAGFGGTTEEVEKVRKMGPAAAAEWLLDFPDQGAEEQSAKDVPDFSSIGDFPKSFREIREAMRGKSKEEQQRFRQMLMRGNREAMAETARWWLNRMATGAHPLQEKLTLFWHGHFTTSFREERSAWLMWRQNELLRRTAAGNFEHFVKGISRDPAMLQYLNNNQNRRGRPNENYARELMELFTLGIGNYTEQDVKEAARAFTGWTSEGDDFAFRRLLHDDGRKTFLGHAGNFDGDDVVDIILRHKACAPFIAGKLFRFFAYDEAESGGPLEQGIPESLGQLLRDNKWNLRPVIRTILRSKAFYSDKAIGVQIKSPVQLVLGTVRLLGVPLPPMQILRNSLQQMGQMPFNPPNVKGWPGGRAWINTATLYVRYNTCVALAGGFEGTGFGGAGFGGGLGPRFQKMRLRAKFNTDGATTAEQVVDHWLARLIQRPVDVAKRQALVESLGGRAADEDAIGRMVQLIVSMPEYQLC